MKPNSKKELLQRMETMRSIKKNYTILKHLIFLNKNIHTIVKCPMVYQEIKIPIALIKLV